MPAKDPELIDASEIQLDSRNANKGTKRGRKVVAQSLDEYGAGRSILLDKNNRAIAGNKTVEAHAARGGKVLVVDTEGDVLVAVRRRDLDLEKDAKARNLATVDNRASELGLEWDPEILKDDVALLGESQDVFFAPDELEKILTSDVVPDFQPQGDGDGQSRLDQKAPIVCPECGHEFQASASR